MSADSQKAMTLGPRIEELEREVQALRRELRVLRMANNELERVVVRDTLTPLYNRRYLITALNERIVRHEQEAVPGVLVFVDVDGLKKINDRHGHNAGDFALVHVARQLAAHIGKGGVAARMGGDEFALLIDNEDRAGAQAQIDALDAAIASARCDYGNAELEVYASFGMADIRVGDRDEDIIARADAHMYAVKRERRVSRAA